MMMMMMHGSIKNKGLSVLLQQASKLPLLAVVEERLVLSDVGGDGVCSYAVAAAAMVSSRRFFHAGVGGGASLVKKKEEPTKTDDDETSSRKVSLDQFPGIMAAHSGLTSSKTINKSKTRRLLRLNPDTGYFEEQQDVAAAANELQVPYGHVCRGSAYGWLFLTDENLDMKLFNPFSGAEIQLPPAKTLPPPSRKYPWPLSQWMVWKAVFSANPSVDPRPVVFLICEGLHLAFCKPGDERWTPLEFPTEGNSNMDVIYHEGQFYVLEYPGYVSAYDIGRSIDDDDHSVKKTLLGNPPKKGWIYSYKSHIVVVDGQLVRIELRERCFCDYCKEKTLKAIEIEKKRDGDTTDEDNSDDEDTDVDDEEEDDTDKGCRLIGQRLSMSTYGIKLRRLDVNEKQWVKMESLGDKAVFVGYNTSFALSASDYPAGVCIPDSIYFISSSFGNEYTRKVCYDVGIYNVKDKTVKPLYPPMPIDGVVKPAPIWIVNAS